MKIRPTDLASIPQATASEVRTGTSQTTVLTPKNMFDASAPVAVSFSSTITLDFNTCINFEIATLTGNFTLANPTNAKPGQSGTIRLVQDVTGNRVISFGPNWRFPGGAASNLLSTAGGTVDMIAYQVSSAGLINASLMKDMKA